MAFVYTNHEGDFQSCDTNGITPSFRYQYKNKSVTPKTVYFELEKMFISKYRPQLEINHLLSQPDQSHVWKFHGFIPRGDPKYI